jgi:hypothetical protein
MGAIRQSRIVLQATQLEHVPDDGREVDCTKTGDKSRYEDAIREPPRLLPPCQDPPVRVKLRMAPPAYPLRQLEIRRVYRHGSKGI